MSATIHNSIILIGLHCGLEKWCYDYHKVCFSEMSKKVVEMDEACFNVASKSTQEVLQNVAQWEMQHAFSLTLQLTVQSTDLSYSFSRLEI